MKIPKSLNISLRIRLIVGVSVMLLPLVVLGASGFFALQRVVDSFAHVTEETIQELSPVSHLQRLILRASTPIHQYIIYGDPAEKEAFVRLSQEMDKAFERAIAAPFGLMAERALVRSASDEWQRARAIGEAILDLPPLMGDALVAQEIKRMDAHIDRGEEILSRVSGLAFSEVNMNLVEAYEVRRMAHLFIAGIFLVGLGTAVLTSLALARAILTPVLMLREGTARFGDGDLAYRVAVTTKDELGQLAMTFNEMAEKLDKSRKALEELAIHDGLTGLHNYREFRRRLGEEMERSRRYSRFLSVLLLDLDNFKTVNDTYGHQMGDEVLRIIATLTCGAVRSVDQVARYGGEEFAIILPETPNADALAIAERIRNTVAGFAIIVAQGQVINITVSIGLAVFPEDGSSEEEVVAAADRALYAAKGAGRNRVYRYEKALG